MSGRLFEADKTGERGQLDEEEGEGEEDDEGQASAARHRSCDLSRWNAMTGMSNSDSVH